MPNRRSKESRSSRCGKLVKNILRNFSLLIVILIILPVIANAHPGHISYTDVERIVVESGGGVITIGETVTSSIGETVTISILWEKQLKENHGTDTWQPVTNKKLYFTVCQAPSDAEEFLEGSVYLDSPIYAYQLEKDTDNQGKVSVRFKIGTKTGRYAVCVHKNQDKHKIAEGPGSGLRRVVLYTVVANPTYITIETDDITAGKINTAYPFTIKLLDQSNKPLDVAYGKNKVELTLDAPPNSGGRLLHGYGRLGLKTNVGTRPDNGLGYSSVTTGNRYGTYTVTAVSVINKSISDTFTVTIPKPDVTEIKKISGDKQSALISDTPIEDDIYLDPVIDKPLIVQVLNGDTPVPYVRINFSIDKGRVSDYEGRYRNSTRTDDKGYAELYVELTRTPGISTITVSSPEYPNIDEITFTATARRRTLPPPPRKIATTLQKVSGDGQSAQVNTQMSNAYVVRVLDQNGAAMSGVTVNFSVSPSGTLSATTATTGTNGEASTTLTLGSTAGTYTVTASVTGITRTVSFTATAEAAPKVATTLESVSGDGQSAQVGTQLSSAFIVRVLDQDDAAMSGVTVNFSVSPSSGSLSATTATTGTNGQASTSLTLGSTTGTYTVTASVAGIESSVSFTATAEDLPPQKIATTLESVSGDGQSAQVGTQLSSAFVVRVLDQDGVAMSGETVSFSVSPSGTLSTTTATTGTDGQASTTLTLGSTAGTYTVTASVAGIASSVSFTATAEAIPDAESVNVFFSEVMYASNGYTDVQWIELYNTSKTETIQLEGWRLTALSPVGETYYNRSVSLVLKPMELGPQQVILIVTGTARHSDSINENQIYDLSEHHNDVLQLDQNPRRIIGITAFTLQLFSKAGVEVDRLGNIPSSYGDSTETLSPVYSFKDITKTSATGRTSEKHRVSLIRRIDNDGNALNGDEIGAWKRAATLPFGETANALNSKTHYGNTTDIGNPGYIYKPLPVPVELSTFNARMSDNAVILNWTTESEVDNAGFNILRSETNDGDFKVINQKLINGAGTTGERNEYKWIDATAKPGLEYYYRIEDVSYAGEKQTLATQRMKGMLSAKNRFITRWGALKK